jgi:hypothetical protein
MIRYNVFQQIHKGLRAVLYDTSMALQQTDFETATEPSHALSRLIETLDFFDGHGHHENNHIFCLLDEHAPELVAEMEAEHEKDHELSKELRKLVASFSNTTTAEEKYLSGTQICHSFNAFIAFNLTHMHKEETVINEALWTHYTDEEIIQANRLLVSNLRTDEMDLSALWMIRSGSNKELVKWLSGIRANTNEEQLQKLLAIVGKELPIERYAMIEQELMKRV